MPKINLAMRLVLPCVCFVLLCQGAFGQATVAQARQMAADKSYDKAIAAYSELYARYPDSVYTEYLQTLMAAKKYKPAEKLVEKQISLAAQNFLLLTDLGGVYDAEGKPGKAREQYEALVQRINGDDMLTQSIVKSFVAAGQDTFAIRTYQRAIGLAGAQYAYFYSVPLAKLYAKQGNIAMAISTLVTSSAPGQYPNVESIDAQLLEIIGNDPERLRQAEKVFIKKINEEPDNMHYPMLLTWLYIQKNDWDGALMETEAVDERNKENGRRLMELARSAIHAKQYEAAAKAYDDVIADGPGLPYYITAKAEKLGAALARLQNSPAYKPEDVSGLATLYDSFLVQYPAYYATQTAADYAMLEAQYAADAPRAIEILQKAIDAPDTRRNMVGNFKLQMADYYVLTGRLWDASLLYSQVDKEFKQDELGEDARFRNSKLAYYMGDFKWAQRQLSVLKAATSELIANDALYLSVLITENVEDTDNVPLQRFAYAGLLLFQNRDKEAETLLDSINHAYPKHPLNDDILMLRADIYLKRHDFAKALGYLKNIYDQYHDDVLGDDAVFKMADIYQNNLNQPDQAKHWYEQLIIDYPGSTYVQTARQRLSDLTNGVNP